MPDESILALDRMLNKRCGTSHDKQDISKVIRPETYEKSPHKSPNTGYEMAYPKPLTEAQKTINNILKIIKESED